MFNPKTVCFFAYLLSSQIPDTSANAWADAGSSLDKLREDVIDALDAVLKGAYATMSQTVDSAIYNVVSETTATILNSSGEFLSQYEAITQAAQDEGLDITECVESFDDRFRNLGSQNVENLENCLRREIESSVQYVEAGALTLINDYFDSYIYTYEKRLLSCLLDEECVNDVAAEIAEAGGELNSKIDSSVEEDVSGLDTQLIGIDDCAITYTAATNGVGEGMLSGLQMCVDAQRSKKRN